MNIELSNGNACRQASPTESMPESKYQPRASEKDELVHELHDFCGKISQYCNHEITADDLNKLSHEIDEMSAKVKMYLRTLVTLNLRNSGQAEDSEERRGL